MQPTSERPPRLSATVMLLRDVEGASAGIEVFMVRRHERSHAVPNAYVFPGGTVRPDDERDGARDGMGLAAAHELSERSDCAVLADVAASVYTCALRELFEEAGVLLALDAAGELLATDEGLAERLDAERGRLQAGDLNLFDLLRSYHLAPAFDALVPYSHWITPEDNPWRFDTWFFAARMPRRQEALHCQVETTAGEWLRPAEALAGAEQGRYFMVYPTLRHLERLAQCASVLDALEHARTKPIRSVQPNLRRMGDLSSAHMPRHLEDTW